MLPQLIYVDRAVESFPSHGRHQGVARGPLFRLPRFLSSEANQLSDMIGIPLPP
jgi:hypothetical protein